MQKIELPTEHPDEVIRGGWHPTVVVKFNCIYVESDGTEEVRQVEWKVLSHWLPNVELLASGKKKMYRSKLGRLDGP